jgi:hypothetical protein
MSNGLSDKKHNKPPERLEGLKQYNFIKKFFIMTVLLLTILGVISFMVPYLLAIIPADVN